MTHELKTWPAFFEEVIAGRKCFEIRKRDRPFAVGDVLRLREWRPFGIHGGADAYADEHLGVTWPLDYDEITPAMIEERYTGREVLVRVTYITAGTPFLPDDLCAMSITPVGAVPGVAAGGEGTKTP